MVQADQAKQADQMMKELMKQQELLQANFDKLMKQ